MDPTVFETVPSWFRTLRDVLSACRPPVHAFFIRGMSVLLVLFHDRVQRALQSGRIQEAEVAFDL